MKKLNYVISKAIVDEQFRKAFLEDPFKATEGFDLSEEEKAELNKIDLKEISFVNAELEERLSKSFINLPSLSGDEDQAHSSTHGNHSSDNGNLHSSTSGW